MPERFSEFGGHSETIDAIKKKEGEFSSLERRKEAIAEIKEIIHVQQEGLAHLIQDVREKAVTKEGQLRYVDALSLVELYSKKCNFNEEQVLQIKASLKEYWRKHIIVEGERQLYNNAPKDLFKECFGIEAKDEVKVVYGAATITFVLSHEDYVNASVYDKPQWGIEKYRDISERSRGIAMGMSDHPVYEGLVNIVDRNSANSGTYAHEVQHQFNKLFIPQEDRGQISQEFLETVIETEKTKKSRRQKIIYALAKNVRKYTIDSRARDEILAQLRSRDDADDIYRVLTTHDSYKYFDDREVESTIDKIDDLFKYHKKESNIEYGKSRLGVSDLEFDYDALKSPTMAEIRPIVQSAYNNYFKDLRQALDAVKVLQELNLPNTDIIPLLQAIPLDRWKILARRFSERKDLINNRKIESSNKLIDYKSIFAKLKDWL